MDIKSKEEDMKKRSFHSAIPVVLAGIAFGAISLFGCSSPPSFKVVLNTEADNLPGPITKVSPPHTKPEIPYYAPETHRQEIKREAPPQSVPSAAPKKKKRG